MKILDDSKQESRSLLLQKIDKEKLPNHIAITMDGNGRWARKRFLPRTLGHIEGVERVRDIVEATRELNIPYLTLYTFSTENWKRPKKEVDTLMGLFVEYLRKEINSLHKNGVKVNIIGEQYGLSEKVKIEVENATNKTKNNDKLNLNIALNYGSRQEITKAFKDMYSDLKNKKIDIEKINEDTIKEYLYTKNQPDPDLFIRTSGEQRLSNFLLYQIAYSELDFVDTLWPDFKREDLYKSIINFQNRSRRYGGI